MGHEFRLPLSHATFLRGFCRRGEKQPVENFHRFVSLKRLGLRDAGQVMDLVSRYYPEDRIQPKTRFAIEEICQHLSML